MKKMFMTIAAIATLGASLYAGNLSVKDEWREGKKSDLEGKAAPKLELVELLNTKKTLAKEMKGKIVVLDFWATWCGPCLRSVPHVNKMQKKYKNKVVFVGVCHPKGGEKMKAVTKQHAMEYIVALDKSGAANKAYGINGYPDYVIIDSKGKVFLHDCRNSMVEEVLDAMIKAKK